MSWKMLLVSCTSTLLPMQVVGAEVKFDKQGCYAVQHHLIQHTDGYVSGSFDVLNIFRLPTKCDLRRICQNLTIRESYESLVAVC